MSKKTWEDIKKEEELGSIQRRLTDEEIDRHLWAVEDSNQWYVEESPFGGPIAPPLITANESTTLYYDVCGYAREGFFHTKLEHENINPLRRGKMITARGRIADKYMHRGRKCFVIETVVTDEDGIEICKTKYTQASIKKFAED